MGIHMPGMNGITATCEIMRVCRVRMMRHIQTSSQKTHLQDLALRRTKPVRVRLNGNCCEVCACWSTMTT
jgi:hypothetical protein